jgi:hypothetical protein
MRRVRTALAAGLGIAVLAGVAVLSQSPLVVLASNSTSASEGLATATASASASACQSGERLPRGTVAIRLSLGAFLGSAVTVKASAAGRVLTTGRRGSGWDARTVTVPVRAVSRTSFPVSVCFAIPQVGEKVELLGARSAPASAAHATNGEALTGRLRIEYLGRGRSSWLALLGSVARNMGFGRAWSGAWIALLVLALMLAASILASRLILGELDG